MKYLVFTYRFTISHNHPTMKLSSMHTSAFNSQCTQLGVNNSGRRYRKQGKHSIQVTHSVTDQQQHCKENKALYNFQPSQPNCYVNLMLTAFAAFLGLVFQVAIQQPPLCNVNTQRPTKAHHSSIVPWSSEPDDGRCDCEKPAKWTDSPGQAN